MPQPISYIARPSTFSKNKICAWSADVLRKELAHTSSFSCATVKKLCVCSLSLCVSLNVRMLNLDGLKNPSQLQPFLITHSCSASAGFYSLQVTRLPRKAQCNTPPRQRRFTSWPLKLSIGWSCVVRSVWPFRNHELFPCHFRSSLKKLTGNMAAWSDLNSQSGCTSLGETWFSNRLINSGNESAACLCFISFLYLLHCCSHKGGH